MTGRGATSVVEIRLRGCGVVWVEQKTFFGLWQNKSLCEFVSRLLCGRVMIPSEVLLFCFIVLSVLSMFVSV